ncbi:MAG: exosome complex exonuclease Rrp41 [Candidatus Marsarchaeota archaeon]|jgi:exosome complex component RRP41|nr:exosome complex exonuclease Rrp41 [Candidatus Marsarchaeota archaeon]MCL5418678.1 exosome complex exonuclease Rrp41 [Candidatus Marsarchaeota archaeon]
MKANKPELIVDGKRLDGRGFGDLRSIKITANVLDNADGSAYIEWGGNKILAAVYGPKEVFPKHFADPTKARVKCRYSMAPFSSLEEHGRSGPNRRAIEISKVTTNVFENVIMLSEFPGSEIDVFIEVLQGDGGTRAAGITAASVALANAGIHMKDLVYAVSAGKIGEDIVIDLNKIEDNYSDCDMPMAIAPRNNDVLLLQMDGGLSKEDLKKAVSMVIEAGKKISSVQKEALKKVYTGIAEKYESNGV